MTRFHSIVYVQGETGDAQATKQAAMERVDAETSKELAAVFRKRLLDVSETFKVPLAMLPGLSIFFKRVGHTAGVAAWCVGPDIVAVTLLLGGFDGDEDNRALAKARRLPTDSPLSAVTLEDVRRRPRPLHALLHCSPAHEHDPGIRAASACLAAVFFSLLGATLEGEK